MAYTFLDLAIDVIKKQNIPMRINDIWNKAVEMGLDKKLIKYGQTPEKTLGARLYVSIKKDGEKSPIIQISKRPALFFLRELSEPKSLPIDV